MSRSDVPVAAIAPQSLPTLVVVVLLALAFVALVALDLVRRHHQAERERTGAEPLPDATLYAKLPTEHVLAKADGGLLNADDRRLVATATVLDDRGHPQAVAYLLHALRRSPEHRVALVARLGAHDLEEVKRHRDLVRALPRSTGAEIREALRRRDRSPAEPADPPT